MLKRIVTLLVLGTLISSPVLAQEKSNSIAVVDMKRILAESTAAKAVRTKIGKKRDQYQAAITKKEEKLREDYQKLERQRSILAPEAVEAKHAEFQKSRSELKKDLQNKRSKLALANAQALEKIQQVVEEVITNLARERGFVMALPRSQIIFAEKELDITNDVVKSLNKKLPKVTVKID
jgi:Skp family chaperone for outer membrane proteins